MTQRMTAGTAPSQLTLRVARCKLAAACKPKLPIARECTPNVASQTFRPPDPNSENSPESATAPPDFERSLTELEAIVDKLEAGDLSLDESLKQFERGVQLTRACQSALKQAEHKVEILMRKSGTNEFETAPFDSDADQTD